MISSNEIQYKSPDSLLNESGFFMNKFSNFHTIFLTIDKASKQINSMKIMGKDGLETTYILKNFRTNDPLEDALFTVNTKSYPKYEVVDMR